MGCPLLELRYYTLGPSSTGAGWVGANQLYSTWWPGNVGAATLSSTWRQVYAKTYAGAIPTKTWSTTPATHAPSRSATNAKTTLCGRIAQIAQLSISTSWMRRGNACACLLILRRIHHVCFAIGPMRDVLTAATMMEATALWPIMHLFLFVWSAILHLTTLWTEVYAINAPLLFALTARTWPLVGFATPATTILTPRPA